MTPLEISELAQGVTDVYNELESDLLVSIARKLALGFENSPTAKWKMQKLAEMGKLNTENLEIIARYSGIAPDALGNALEIAARTAIDELEPAMRALALKNLSGKTVPRVSRSVKQTLSMYQSQAKATLNLVNTVMGYKAKGAYVKAVNRVAELAEIAEEQGLLNALNKAAGSVITGAVSRQSALRTCIKEMSEKGIPAFVDKAGREWTPEAYINMDIRTTVSNVAHETSFARMDECGVNLLEVSSHIGARPLCEPYQGKIFNRLNTSGVTHDLNGGEIPYAPWSSTSYGKAAGLLGINCHHQVYPFFPGLSLQTYFPKETEANAKRYKEVQGQRALERRVRQSKRECEMLKVAGDKEGLKAARTALTARTASLKRYCVDKDLKFMPDRITVITPAKSASRGVDNGGGSGIIEVKKLTSFSSVKEALEAKGIVFDASLSKIDEACLIANARKLDDLLNQYPAVQEYAKTNKITFKSGGGTFIGQTSTNFSISRQELALNPAYYRDAAEYVSRQEESIKTGFKMEYAKDDLISYTTSHEFGHVIENCLVRQYQLARPEETAADYNKMFGGNLINISAKKLQTYFKKHTDRVQNEVLKIARGLDPTIDPKNHNTFYPFLSGYGQTSSAEFFAECFANSQADMPNVLGRATKEYLKGALK